MSLNTEKRVTLEDVAKEARVGAMTVSRVISGHPYVRQETADRVRRAIAKLSYRPSQAARILSGKASRSIGLIVPDLKDPFFGVIANSVETTARERNYLVWVVSSNNDPAVEETLIDQMLGHHVEGIAVIPARGDQRHLKTAAKGSTPIVTLDRPIRNAEVDCILTDNRAASARLVRHLVEGHGRKRIVCLGYNRDLYTIENRINGYKDVMRSAKLPIQCHLNLLTQEENFDTVASTLRSPEPPDAFFTINNVSTIMTLESLRRLRIKVPKQIALVGFDDIEHGSLLYCPPTVISQPSAEIGSSAVQHLIRRIESKKPTAVEHIVLPAQLLVRSSCGCRTSDTEYP